ncbi:somatostatin receptor type 4 [Elysia marginata]|uniref:Somatostatin receptor type 4 n=1 Tax=Elysia marginata TaxID=1093978 RepID=A0AAV4G463_9GAST|nr:somatostatin receptor type 4 [Elysia marginata]
MATNITTELPPEESVSEGNRILMIVIRPSICGLGFVTNILSLMVFLQPSMRNLSCSVYLATKAISDFIFLLTTFIVWLTSVDIGLLNTHGICQLVVFASYLTAFLSIWLVVTLTIENLLCVVKPWFVQRSCNARTARILTTAIVVLGIGFYQFALWNNGLGSQTREVEIFVDVDYEDSNIRNQTESNGYLYPVTESIFKRKIISAAGVTESSNLSDSENSMFIRRSMVFISGQMKAKHQMANVEDLASVNSVSAALQTLPQASTEPTPYDIDYVPSIPTPTNTTLVTEIGPTACIPLKEFSHFAVALTYVDSLMTLLVPLIILSVTNAAIIVLAVRASRKQQSRDILKSSEQYSYHKPSTGYTSTSCATLDINVDDDTHHHKTSNASSTNVPADGAVTKRQKNSNASRNGSFAPHSARRSTRASLETQASRFLFSVSMTLLVFHMPSHLLRLKFVLHDSASPLDMVLFRWFETLYISHYAIGFFVYFSFGTNFRRVFSKLVCKS